MTKDVHSGGQYSACSHSQTLGGRDPGDLNVRQVVRVGTAAQLPRFKLQLQHVPTYVCRTYCSGLISWSVA